MAASWSSTTPKRPLRQEPTKNCCHKRSWQCGAGRYGLDKSKSSTKPDRLSKQPSMCHGCPHAWQFTIQNSTFRIPSRPSFPRNPLSPPCIPPKFVLHGLSSKSKFLAVTATPEYMLIGAIIPHPSGDVFLKILGKEADLKKTKADFEKLIASAFEKAAK